VKTCAAFRSAQMIEFRGGSGCGEVGQTREGGPGSAAGDGVPLLPLGVRLLLLLRPLDEGRFPLVGVIPCFSNTFFSPSRSRGLAR
jgi:hypothetical protein